MKIHAIQTGTVAIKSRQVEGVGHGVGRQIRTFTDRRWTEPLPIYAFAIEHPDGVIVVDTGETARASRPGYFPAWHPYFRFGVREAVEPDQEIGPQLARLGITAGDVRQVVLTHLHTDHAGGLHHFPRSEVLVSRGEWHIASGRVGRVRGYVNNRFPDWLEPTIVDLQPEPFGPFPQSLPITAGGDVTIVPAAGHTPGQIAVVVKDGETSVLLAGDSSYTQSTMLRGAVDGVAPDERAARLTLERIRSYAEEHPTVYLPSHDPHTAVRLSELSTVPCEPVSAVR
jgi:glyoxylase-like metal-dependent hydrolase (beta-lactamase superfamily II)